ncbi:MAG TPA: hypothetical protein VGK78_17640 [Nocardioides sp.]|uniref:hypothetical protein n=1 Tax=Nocardioides sp. TaxID=35761 RepID=UPI002F3FDBD7
MSSGAHAPGARDTVEVACDESGFVGGSLFGGTRVFTHASVRLAPDEAAGLADEIRRRTGAGDQELKASRLNRPWAHPVARWLCGPDGPLQARAVVHVTDTRLFGLARLAQVVLADTTPEGWWSAREDPHSWAQALRLSAVLGELSPTWERELLRSARDLLWIRRRRRLGQTIEGWADVVRAVADRVPEAVDRLFVATWASPDALARARTYVAAPPAAPLSEPLLPALRWTVHHWSALGDVDVVHDEQSVLTPARVTAIADELERSYPGRRLVGFRRVDSRDDARVQIADLVAGVVRRVLEGHLSGEADDPALPLAHLVAEDSLVLPTTWGAPFFGEVSANAMPSSTAS